MANNPKEEPKTAPQADRWYNLTLGSSFKPDSSNKYCTLRYEFKPASIDKTKHGSLKKTKENRVSVEFQNNQIGKPKVTFEGSSEDYKESDAVLFFDGHTFRLERLHRAVKQLRHLRQPGESAAAASAAAAAAVIEPRLSPPPAKAPKTIHVGRSAYPALPLEVEQIDIGGPENPAAGSRSFTSKGPETLSRVVSPDPKNNDINDEADDDHQDIDIDDIFGSDTSPPPQDAAAGFDMNAGPLQNDDNDDDEIADVDDSGDEVDKGPNAAEELRRQVTAAAAAAEEEEERRSSSSSSSSGSGTSSSSSSSSSSDASDEDSVNSI